MVWVREVNDANDSVDESEYVAVGGDEDGYMFLDKELQTDDKEEDGEEVHEEEVEEQSGSKHNVMVALWVASVGVTVAVGAWYVMKLRKR